MKKHLLFVIFYLLINNSYNQVLIHSGNDSGAANSSSILEIRNDENGNNGGLLIPRVTLTGKNDTLTISKPAEGLLVYNTGANSDFDNDGILFWNGKEWRRFVEETASYQDITYHINDSDYYRKSINAYIGPFFEQDMENGISLGDFHFKIEMQANATSSTAFSDNQDVYVMYKGSKTQDTIISYASTLYGAVNYDSFGNKALRYNIVSDYNNTRAGRNTSILEKGKWYAWGEPGLVALSGSIEKRQYTFSVIKNNVQEFYRCEFMAVASNNTNGTSQEKGKVILIIERFVP